MFLCIGEAKDNFHAGEASLVSFYYPARQYGYDAAELRHL